MTENGMLQLTNQNGDIIQTVALVEEPKKEAETKQNEIVHQSPNKTMGYYGIYAVILTILGVVLIGVRKIKER